MEEKKNVYAECLEWAMVIAFCAGVGLLIGYIINNGCEWLFGGLGCIF